MSLNRQKVDFNDPLSMFSPPADAEEDADKAPSQQVVGSEAHEEFRTVDIDKVKFGEGKKKKGEAAEKTVVASSSTSIPIPAKVEAPVADITPSPAPIQVASTPSPAPIQVAPTPVAVTVEEQKAPEVVVPPTPPVVETEEDLFKPRTQKVVDDDGEDLFDYSKEVIKKTPANTSVTKQIAPTIKLDMNRGDDDVSDLNVAKLLQREDDLDFNTFGKIADHNVKQKLTQRKMDLDIEDDFLKQLDKITGPSSSSTKASTSSSSQLNDPQLSYKTNLRTDNIDLNAMNLNDYIAQQSAHSGGGLFD